MCFFFVFFFGRRTQRFEAHIWSDKKQVYLGAYSSKSQAARAHDIAALRMRGPAAAELNFPELEYASLQPLLQTLPQNDIVSALRSCSRSLPFFLSGTGSPKPSAPREEEEEEESSSEEEEEEQRAGTPTTADAAFTSAITPPSTAEAAAAVSRKRKSKRKQTRPTSALDTHNDQPAGPGDASPPKIKTGRGAPREVAETAQSRGNVPPTSVPLEHTRVRNTMKPPSPMHQSYQSGIGAGAQGHWTASKPPLPPLFMGKQRWNAAATREDLPVVTMAPLPLVIQPLGQRGPGGPGPTSPRALRAARRSRFEGEEGDADTDIGLGSSPSSRSLCAGSVGKAPIGEAELGAHHHFATPQLHREMGAGLNELKGGDLT